MDVTHIMVTQNNKQVDFKLIKYHLFLFKKKDGKDSPSRVTDNHIFGLHCEVNLLKIKKTATRRLKPCKYSMI